MELLQIGWVCKDGQCRFIRVMARGIVEADGYWVRGFHDPANPERSHCFEGRDLDEGRRLVDIWWNRMASLNAEK